jgi:hypothetical protein
MVKIINVCKFHFARERGEECEYIDFYITSSHLLNEKQKRNVQILRFCSIMNYFKLNPYTAIREVGLTSRTLLLLESFRLSSPWINKIVFIFFGQHSNIVISVRN